MPMRSSSSPADIGLSKSEYEEAVNLEKLYFLVNKNDRCAICGRGGVAGVDVSRYEFLCAGCSSGKSSFKRIGEDRFSSFEVNKLCARFDRDSGRRGSRRQQSRSPPPRGSGGRPSRGSRRASRRQPSPVYAESESDDDEEPSPPPPRRSHSMPRGADSSSGRYKQRHHHQQSGDPFDNVESGGGWGGDMAMSQAGPRATGGAGGMGMMSNCSPAAAGMLGLGMQQQPGLAGMLGGQGGLGPGAGMMGAGLLQQQQPWGSGGAQQLLQQQQQLLQQQQQLLLLRQQQQQQQQMAAAAGRGVGAGMLAGTSNIGGGLTGLVQSAGRAGGVLELAMQRAQTFSPAGNAGMLPQQQQQLQSPFFSVQQQPQYPLASSNAPSSNPFLSVQPQQQPGLGPGATGSFAHLQQQPGGLAFTQLQHVLQQQSGTRPMGAPATPVMGAQQSSNPFTSLGAAQRSPTPAVSNAARFAGAGGAGAATGGGSVYNTSLW